MMTVFMVLGFAKQSLKAQTDLPRHIIKINPVSLLLLTGNVKIERRLNERFSGQLGLYVGAPNLKYNADSIAKSIQYFMLGIVPELRFHVNFNHRPNPSGLFVAAFCKYTFVKEKYRSEAFDPDRQGILFANAHLRRHVASLGFLVGYQFLFKEKFALDLFIGPQYSASKTTRVATCAQCDGDESLIGRPGLSFDGIEPRAGIAVGYAF